MPQPEPVEPPPRSALILEVARPYWLIAQRFHSSSRDRLLTAMAVHSMIQLGKELGDSPVLRRVKGFISKHRVELPGKLPNDDGPTRA